MAKCCKVVAKEFQKAQSEHIDSRWKNEKNCWNVSIAAALQSPGTAGDRCRTRRWYENHNPTCVLRPLSHTRNNRKDRNVYGKRKQKRNQSNLVFRMSLYKLKVEGDKSLLKKRRVKAPFSKPLSQPAEQFPSDLRKAVLPCPDLPGHCSKSHCFTWLCCFSLASQ